MNNNMATRLADFGKLVLGMGCLMVPIGSPAVAQEIEIIGNDGKQVEIAPQVDAEVIPPASSPALDRESRKGLTVLGPDGQPMFLPTENTRSVQIQRSVSTQIVDGQRTVSYTHLTLPTIYSV